MAERRAEVAGVPLFWREAEPPAGGASTPVLFLHGAPTHGGIFEPFLALTGGVAPDLPGFGRSGKSQAFDYSLRGYGDFIERFADHLGLERLVLATHDWGVLGLALAQRRPERVERLVLIDGVPLLPGYRWHRYARLWRVPVLGELAMGATTRWAFRRSIARALAGDRAAARTFADGLYEHFDHGTQRAMLQLLRSASTDELARAGQDLARVTAPALVVWGAEDPFIPAAFARAYAAALGGDARVEIVPDAGHWPWVDRPELVKRVARFVTGAEQ